MRNIFKPAPDWTTEEPHIIGAHLRAKEEAQEDRKARLERRALLDALLSLLAGLALILVATVVIVAFTPMDSEQFAVEHDREWKRREGLPTEPVFIRLKTNDMPPSDAARSLAGFDGDTSDVAPVRALAGRREVGRP